MTSLISNNSVLNVATINTDNPNELQYTLNYTLPDGSRRSVVMSFSTITNITTFRSNLLVSPATIFGDRFISVNDPLVA